MYMQDTRNVIDKYKGVAVEAIVQDLDAHHIGLEIAIENLARDFNMGTIIRTANAFGVRHVHVVGSRQWNKRGAMMTDKYLHIHYYANVDEFVTAMGHASIIAVDNVAGSVSLDGAELPEASVLVFGSERDGLSREMLIRAARIVAIDQYGSTRSLNVGVAAGIVMHEWSRRHTRGSIDKSKH
jgi:tRNA G18 (ribose-2'-O)-methylase SpoU